MKDMMEYKGYYGSVHYNDDDQVFPSTAGQADLRMKSAKRH